MEYLISVSAMAQAHRRGERSDRDQPPTPLLTLVARDDHLTPLSWRSPCFEHVIDADVVSPHSSRPIPCTTTSAGRCPCPP